MNVLIVVLFLIIIIPLVIMRKGYHRSKIDEEIRSIGGEVLNVERGGFFSGLGPFHVVGKGRVVYKIEYRVDNETKVGWVRFGGLMGPDWRL